MREIARAQQGFVPTQSRIVRAVANLFKLPINPIGSVSVLDAGCGLGHGLRALRAMRFAARFDFSLAEERHNPDLIWLNAQLKVLRIEFEALKKQVTELREFKL